MAKLRSTSTICGHSLTARPRSSSSRQSSTSRHTVSRFPSLRVSSRSDAARSRGHKVLAMVSISGRKPQVTRRIANCWWHRPDLSPKLLSRHQNLSPRRKSRPRYSLSDRIQKSSERVPITLPRTGTTSSQRGRFKALTTL